jgi:hypothetical protein
MSDEQKTNELVSDLFIWAKSLEEHHSTYTLAKTARTVADRLEALQARVVALEAEIARRDKSYGCDGCSTGDCPHDTVQECADAMSKIIQEQSATISGLQSRVGGLERECYKLWGALGGDPN